MNAGELDRLLDELAGVGVHIAWCRHIEHSIWLPREQILLLRPHLTIQQIRSFSVVQDALGAR